MVSAGLLSAGIPAFSQEHDSLLHLLPGVEIKSSQTPYSPVGVTLDYLNIESDYLLKNQGNTLMGSLEKIPGIRALSTGTGISKPVIRGMSLNRVVINEYGIKQEGQQWGADHGLEIDPFNVNRMELVKGPASVRYGSDGIGGVINILPPAIPRKDTFHAGALLQYKSNNNQIGTSVHVAHNKNDYYTLARITYQDYGSYRVPATSFTYNGYRLPLYRERLKNTGGNELGISLMQGIRRKWGYSSLYFSIYRQKAGFFPGAFGIPRAYQLNDIGKDRHVDLPRQEVQHIKIISNTHGHIGNVILDADIGWQYNRREELSKPHAHGNGPAPEGERALGLHLQTFTANFQLQAFPRYAFSLITGLAMQHQENSRDGYEFLIPAFRQTQAGLFSSLKYEAGKTTWTGAVRADLAHQYAPRSYTTQYDEEGLPSGTVQRSPEIRKKYINGSAAAGFVTEWTKNWKIKFNAGTAYRIPTVTELTANGIHHGTFRHEMGDSTLSPEKGYMLDLSLSTRQKNIQASVSPFLNYFDQYIYLRPSGLFSTLPEAGQLYHYTAGKTVFTGFEASLNLFADKRWSSLTAMEYVWNKNITTGIPLPFTPPYSLLQEFTWAPVRFWKLAEELQFRLSGQYFASQTRTDINEPATNGYFLMDFSTDLTLPAGRHKLSCHFQIRNLLNTIYYNNMSRYRILELPEQGRNIQLILKYEL